MAKETDAAAGGERNVTRRRFVSFVGWGSFTSFFGGITLGTLRFFFPRILYLTFRTPQMAIHVFSRGIFRTDSKPQPWYVVVA